MPDQNTETNSRSDAQRPVERLVITPYRKPDWWPTNPYPEDIFPMTTEEYIAAVPDPKLRSAISGHLARWAWGVAERMIWERICDNTEEAL